MRYKTAFPIVAALILSLMAGCSGAGGDGSLSRVPQWAEMVGHIGISEILGDTDLIRIYDALPKDAEDPQTFEAALDAITDETGIDLRVFDELTIFGDTATSTDDIEYMGVIGEGTFDEDGLLTSIEGATGNDLVQNAHGEYDVHVASEADVAVAFLDDSTVVFGTVDAVVDVIDVEAGNAPALSGEVLDIFGGLGDVVAKLAASADQLLAEEDLPDSSSELPVPVDLSSLVEVETTGLTFTRDEQSIAIELDISFASGEAASDAKGLITMVKAAVNMYGVTDEVTGGLPIPEDWSGLIPQVLAELEAGVEEGVLTLSWTMTIDEIEELLSA
jgi:hypothetical protein